MYVCVEHSPYTSRVCNVCMYVCMCVCMCVCTHASMYLCMYAFVYVCRCVSAYVCMSVCMYIYVSRFARQVQFSPILARYYQRHDDLPGSQLLSSFLSSSSPSLLARGACRRLPRRRRHRSCSLQSAPSWPLWRREIARGACGRRRRHRSRRLQS